MEPVYSSEFDGRTWVCRGLVPDGVWRDLERVAARQPTRQTRKALRGVAADLVAAVVVDAADLAERLQGRREKSDLFFVEVLPALVSHYESARGGDLG